MPKSLTFPVDEKTICELNVGDMILINGKIYCGRDAVLPKLVAKIKDNTVSELNLDLQGSVIFHTAVSVAGVGPTSSNKLEIESSIPVLSQGGVKLHLGKGALKPETVEALNKNNSVFAVIPPVTALLESKTISRRVVAFEEEGMEALHELEVKDYPAIIVAAHGVSLYDK